MVPCAPARPGLVLSSSPGEIQQQGPTLVPPPSLGLLLHDVTMAGLQELRFPEEKPLLRGQEAAELVSRPFAVPGRRAPPRGQEGNRVPSLQPRRPSVGSGAGRPPATLRPSPPRCGFGCLRGWRLFRRVIPISVRRKQAQKVKSLGQGRRATHGSGRPWSPKMVPTGQWQGLSSSAAFSVFPHKPLRAEGRHDPQCQQEQWDCFVPEDSLPGTEG